MRQNFPQIASISIRPLKWHVPVLQDFGTSTVLVTELRSMVQDVQVEGQHDLRRVFG